MVDVCAYNIMQNTYLSIAGILNLVLSFIIFLIIVIHETDDFLRSLDYLSRRETLISFY